MKKILIVLYASILALVSISAAGCGSREEDPAPKEQKEEETGRVKEPERKEEKENGPKESGIAAPSATGALHVEGTKLCGSHGEAVQLRGISTHGMAWFPDYINEECFAQLRNEWKANVIRLAMYTAESGGYCTDGDKEYLKGLIRSGVQYASKQDMYVIIDWHILSDNNPNMHLDEAKAFFAEISSEYADADNVLYEICNEPNGSVGWGDIKSYAQEIIPVIRANDKEAVIIVGTPNWSQFVDQAAADPITGYENLMYTLHFYAATHKEDLRGRMTAAIDAGLPVFVTEYGICDASGNGAVDIEQADQWVDLMDRYGVSYVAWNLSNKDESSAMLLSSCGKTSGFAEEDLSEAGQWLYQMLQTRQTEVRDGQTADEPAGSEQPTDGEQTAGNEQRADGERTTDSEQPADSERTAQDGENQKDDKIVACGDIEAVMYQKNSWEEDGRPVRQYELTVKNTSDRACTSWELYIPFEEEISLADGWNGDYSVEDGAVHILSKEYNGTIPAGGEIKDVGFIVKIGG